MVRQRAKEAENECLLLSLSEGSREREREKKKVAYSHLYWPSCAAKGTLHGCRNFLSYIIALLSSVLLLSPPSFSLTCLLFPVCLSVSHYADVCYFYYFN